MSRRSIGVMACLLLSAIPGILFPVPSFAQTEEFAPGEVIVKFAPTVSSSQAADFLADAGAVRIKDFRRIGATLVRLEGMTVFEAMAAYAGSPYIEYIEPNYALRLLNTPNDPDYGLLWGLNNTGQTGGTPDADIDAPEAWDQFTGTGNVIVGIIDTGIDYTHPDLAANIWTNTGEIPGNGIDDDQNGWIDDIHGWDAINQDGDPMDDNSHGTHCAGTIGGVGDNGLGVPGVNWTVKLMALKFLSAGGGGYTDDAVECLEYAVAMGATLTSNSWGGGGYSQALEDAITDAYQAGQLFVAAAGNSGQDNDAYPNYPSNYDVPNVVAVGATDHDDDRVSTGFWASSFGATTVDVGAPGLDIYSTVPGGGYGYKSGTSMATPHVAGALALLKGVFPALPPETARLVLINSADPKPQLDGLWVSGGRLNVNNMLAGMDTIPPAAVGDLTVIETASSWVDLQWTASGDDGLTGTAFAYDIRFADYPLDETNFDAAAVVEHELVPLPSGGVETVRAGNLDFLTTYHFALKVLDEYGNTSGISNLTSATTLGVPAILLDPTSLAVALETGQQAIRTVTVSNDGDGVLDFEAAAISVDPLAVAMRDAGLTVIDGIVPSGSRDEDGETVPALSPAETDLLLGRLTDYSGVVAASGAASGLPVIGVGGGSGLDLQTFLMGNAQLAGLFVFEYVDYVFDDLTPYDGLIVAEYDFNLSEQGAIKLADFTGSGRPLFIGMDDFDDVWSGTIPGLLGPMLGIGAPADGNFCVNGPVNPSHPVTVGIPQAIVGGSWCNDNDSFTLDGADWLFRDGSTGANFGVAYDGPARTVTMGENLASVWYANEQLNVNAVLWMMEGGGVPAVDPAFGSIPAGGSLDVDVIFDAADLCTDVFLSEVVFSSNDPANPEAVVSAEMAVTGRTDIDLSAVALDFGAAFVNGLVLDTLRVRNAGCDVLSITSIVSDHPDFTLDTTPFDLSQGQGLDLVVSFIPSDLGVRSGTLTFMSTDPDEPVVTVDVQGVGLEAPVISVSPTSLSTNLLTGQVDVQTVTVSNLGGSDLAFSIRSAGLDTLGSPTGTARVLNPDAPEVPGIAYDAGSTPFRDPLPAPAVARGLPLAQSLEILILGGGTFTELQNELLAYAEISVVDVFNGSSQTPTLADLEPYNVVILATGNPYSDPTTTGNVLAEYIDGGGGVVQTVAAFVEGFEVRGRFLNEGYGAYSLGYGPIGDGLLGTYDPTHPIMADVDYVYGDLLATAPLVPGAELVASWNIGEPLVATQADNVVGVNLYFASSGYWDGDAVLLVRNACLWLTGGAFWLRPDPREGILAPGGSLDVAVTLDATDLCTDTYLGELRFTSNDPVSPEVTVQAAMMVQGEPDVAVSDTLLAYGQVLLGDAPADTLVIGNPGCDLLTIDAVTIDNPEFSTVAGPFGILPGGVTPLVVTFTPVTLGVKSATLTLTTNDPDEPVVVVLLTAEVLPAPVAGVDPTSLTSVLVPGGIDVQTLTVSNTGGSDLDWSLRAVPRNPVAAAMQQAAAEAVAGLEPVPAINEDGETVLALDPEQRAEFSLRLDAYRTRAEQLGAFDVLPVIGVGGAASFDLMFQLLDSPELVAEFAFLEVDYWSDDLSALAGLAIAEFDANVTEASAGVLRDFFDSGRPIVMGMDDFDSVWSGAIAADLTAVFGVEAPQDGDLCSNGRLNPGHPINQGLPGFTIGGSWCNDNDHFQTAGAEWIIDESLQGRIFGTAHESTARTVLLGENLAYVWSPNVQQNVNAILWMMQGGGLPKLDPSAGVLPAGGTQPVQVTFDATNLCGDVFLSDVILASNDPLQPEIVIPASLTVTGEPDIEPGVTALDFGQVYLTATVMDTLWIHNNACGLLEIASIAIDDPVFSAEGGPLTIPGSASYPLAVAFAPADTGSFTATLTITSNDPDETVVTVDLLGRGVLGPEILVAPASFTVDLFPGESATDLLEISNLGQADLVWNIGVAVRDTMAAALRSAASAAIAGIEPGIVPNPDGEPVPTLSEAQTLLLQQRLEPYNDLVAQYHAAGDLPLVGVGGASSFSLIFDLLADSDLVGLYGFQEVFYPTADLSALDGLIIAETDNGLDVSRAQVIRDFFDSGRPVVLGMDDLDADWYDTVPALLGPVFGIATPYDGDLCYNVGLNPDHPVTATAPPFVVGGSWCNDNDYYVLADGDWLFRDNATSRAFGVAQATHARSVLMGENLAYIWTANPVLNARALIWAMGGQGLPTVDPRSGVVAGGQTAQVTVTFNAPQDCGQNYLSSILVFSNDPVNHTVTVPVEMRVLGEPNLAVSDTQLVFPQIYVGETAVDSLVVTNNGCDILDVTSLTIAPSQFATVTDPFSLDLGESRTLVVEFTPTAAGGIAGMLEIQSNDPDRPSVVVALEGAGMFAPAIGVDPLAFDVSVPVGGLRTEHLVVSNSGQGTLEFALTSLESAKFAGIAGIAGGAPAGRSIVAAPPAKRLPVVTGEAPRATVPFAAAAGPAPVAASEARPAGDKVLVDLDVLLLGSGDLSVIRSQLLSQPGIRSVDVFETRYAVPVLADLMPYHAVILANNHPFQDPVATGDVVADYVDLGGGVVQTEPSFVVGYNLAGRFWDGGYSAFTLGFDPTGVSTLGQFQATHPIMDGVDALWGNLLAQTNLSAGASWVGSWTNGSPLVATKGNKVVGVNLFVAYPGHWTGDAALLLRNAAFWAGGTASWLKLPVSIGTVAPGDSLSLEVVFDPGNLPEGDFSAEILVTSNDPLVPEITIPVRMVLGGGGGTVGMQILARTGGLVDFENFLGARIEATDGYDGGLDLPEPTPPPTGYLSAYFPHPEWSTPFGERFMTDYRAMYDPAVAAKSWDFRVETDSPDSVVLDFDPYFATDGTWPLSLFDHTSGMSVNLLPTLQYTFMPTGSDLFTITLGAQMPPLDPVQRNLPAGWAMIGAPLEPAPGAATWDDVLFDDLPGTGYLFSYEGAAGYAQVEASDPVVRGQGLWVATTDAAAWTMTGVRVEEPLAVELRQGWNLVGYPLWFPASVAGLTVEKDGISYTWAGAVAAGLVSPQVYDYDPVLGDYVLTVGLEAWRGYWIAAHAAGVSVVFDYRSMVAPAATVVAVKAGTMAGSGGTPTVQKTAGVAWQMTVHAGDSAAVSFGRSEDASAGFDAAYDMPVAPVSPAGPAAVSLAIPHPEWGLATGDRFRSDVIGTESGSLSWEVTVRAAEPGPVTLTWDASALPADLDLQVYLPSENRVLGTVKETSSVVVTVGAGPVPVVFRSADGVTDVPWQLAGLDLHNVPNPFNPSTDFRFNLPEGGKTLVRIYDLRGALIREIDGGVMPAGPARVRWAGRDGHGSEVASGIYFYRLFLDGRQLGETRKMSLVK
ncbi:MAG: choice-of-anchor D domain-containing protein [bacterium]